jgi:hypothetical protein
MTSQEADTAPTPPVARTLRLRHRDPPDLVCEVCARAIDRADTTEATARGLEASMPATRPDDRARPGWWARGYSPATAGTPRSHGMLPGRNGPSRPVTADAGRFDDSIDPAGRDRLARGRRLARHAGSRSPDFGGWR